MFPLVCFVVVFDFNLCVVCVDVFSGLIKYGLVPFVSRSSAMGHRQQLCTGVIVCFMSPTHDHTCTQLLPMTHSRRS